MKAKKESWLIAALCLGAGLLAGCGQESREKPALAASLPETIDFNFHVKPILSDRCFFCHGPDRENQKAGLRIDTPEGALEHILESGGKAFVAGDVAASEAFQRILSDDPERIMPPPNSNLVVTDYEKAIIERWIREGAEYKTHWAYAPPERPEADSPDPSRWGENEIDGFVLKRLEREGLEPSEEADKESLIRRVTFDLTGLPPTLEDIDAFLADESPQAYERLVDGLLARESYGERMAVDWMDVSRFADTHGFSTDFFRDMSPWRDWVIDAFNENQRFDEFVTWQLAGDLLPNPSVEQRLATAFNRLHPQNGEGGIVNEEFLIEYAADRVQTVGTAFLGATMECVRCHDHKYDPILHEEFYAVSSFFNNVDESGQISYDPDDMPVPTLLLPAADEQEAIAALEESVAAQEEALQAIREDAREAYQSWRSEIDREKLDTKGSDALLAYFPLEKSDSNDAIRNAVDETAPGRTLFGANLNKTEGPAMDHVSAEGREAIRVNGDDPLYFPSTSGFNRSKAFSVSIETWIPEAVKGGTLFHYNKAGILYNYKGFEVSLKDGYWDVRFAHTFPYNAIWMLSETPVAKERWQQVTLVYDGSSQARGVQLYVDGSPVAMRVEQDNLYKDFEHTREKVREEVAVKVGGRWRSKGLPGGLVDELRVFGRALTEVEARSLAGKATVEPSELEWEALYFNRYHDVYRAGVVELSALRERLGKKTDGVKEVMVMDESASPVQAHMLTRGAYDQKAKPVEPGVPAVMTAFPEDLPQNRLGFARWLTGPEHPLMSRVTVNRYWQMFFGKGIVGTPEDFGNQGDLPTHPALLDWLAREFIDSGWDVKGLLKTIAMSATYRQSSRCGEELRARDPGNQLLARGPQQRLSAEMIRDNALAASGLLVRKLGGPSVYPYQPEGLWKMNNSEYTQGSGEDLYRRSLYTVWKRTVPPPTMNSFDAPTRAYCFPKRQQTNTPLQALALMNDPQFVEAARALATEVYAEESVDEARLEMVYRRLTSRFPSEKEKGVLMSIFEGSLASFSEELERAEAFLSVGEYPNNGEGNQAAIAALGVVANIVMNHDAAVIKR